MGRFLVALLSSFSLLATSCTVESAATPEAPVITIADRGIDLPRPQRYFVNLSSVVFISCGTWVGTAEVIGKNKLMTAAHVVGNNAVCQVGSSPAVVTENNKALDYAIIDVTTSAVAQPMKISCAGFQPRKTYYAIGYAHGRDFAITRLVATANFEEEGRDGRTGTLFTHTRILQGEVFSGMSGGPIVDENGVQVGIVAATVTGIHPRALSRELKDTSVCTSR